MCARAYLGLTRQEVGAAEAIEKGFLHKLGELARGYRPASMLRD